MRVALKIAYEGRSFFGHQRQPDRRTVEGECIRALRADKILKTPHEAFFRSASRTDRGVSAIGNVIAFNTTFPSAGVVGAFNNRARDVWAWAFAGVPDSFHPRHANARWYRYHLVDRLPIDALRDAAAAFVGTHDFGSFSSELGRTPLALDRLDVAEVDGLPIVDIRARSFRRGMVRRIVSAMVGHARGDVPLAAIRRALRGERHDFGAAPPEPLFLMDVAYDFPFQTVLKPKAVDEWSAVRTEIRLRMEWLRALEVATSPSPRFGSGKIVESR
jgi:tRNA pseudouridine38-40 synthase